MAHFIYNVLGCLTHWDTFALALMLCKDFNLAVNLVLCEIISFLKNGPTPASFSFIFVFSNTHYILYNK